MTGTNGTFRVFPFGPAVSFRLQRTAAMVLSAPFKSFSTVLSSLSILSRKEGGVKRCSTNMCFGKRRGLAGKLEIATRNSCLAFGLYYLSCDMKHRKVRVK